MFLGALFGYIIGLTVHAPLLGALLGITFVYIFWQVGMVLSPRLKAMLAGGVIGFLAGALLGLHWLGFLLGMYVGATMKPSRRGHYQFHHYFRPMDHQHQQFIEALFYTLGYVAKQAGHVRPQDIAYSRRCMNNLGYNKDQRSAAKEAFRDGKNAQRSPLDLLSSIQIWLAPNPQARELLYKCLKGYEDSQAQLNNQQRHTLSSVYHFLGVRSQSYQSHRTYQRTPHQSSDMDLHAAYRLLGCSSTDSAAAVKKAYRVMMAKYHPDRLMSKGLSQEQLKKYTEKAKSIQQAYQLIKEAKGY